jgi:hypothetical protein
VGFVGGIPLDGLNGRRRFSDREGIAFRSVPIIAFAVEHDECVDLCIVPARSPEAVATVSQCPNVVS